MKKLISVIALVSLLFSSVFLTATAAENISIYINGEIKNFTPVPQIISGIVMAPVDSLSKNLGVKVTLDEKKWSATLVKGTTKIVLYADKNYARVNGKSKPLAIPSKKNK